jgi:hypothetical protein
MIQEIEHSLKLRIKQSQPALRQVCPACGEQMWLADLEPALAEGLLAETLTVSCACGYTCQRTRTRPESQVGGVEEGAQPPLPLPSLRPAVPARPAHSRATDTQATPTVFAGKDLPRTEGGRGVARLKRRLGDPP